MNNCRMVRLSIVESTEPDSRDDKLLITINLINFHRGIKGFNIAISLCFFLFVASKSDYIGLIRLQFSMHFIHENWVSFIKEKEARHM